MTNEQQVRKRSTEQTKNDLNSKPKQVSRNVEEGQDMATSGVAQSQPQRQQQSQQTTTQSKNTSIPNKTESASQTSVSNSGTNPKPASQNSSTQISKKSDLSPFHASIREHIIDPCDQLKKEEASKKYEEGSKLVFTAENLTNCGMSTVKWSEEKDKTTSFTLDIAGGGSVDVVSTTTKIKIGAQELPVRKVDLGPTLKDKQGNNKGPADFSFALLNEDGTKSTNYFTLHYDKDGKLVDMSHPKDELHFSKEGAIYIEREGKKFTLPVNKSQYESMQQAIGKSSPQVDKSKQEATDLVSGMRNVLSQSSPSGNSVLPNTKPRSNSKSTGTGLQ